MRLCCLPCTENPGPTDSNRDNHTVAVRKQGAGCVKCLPNDVNFEKLEGNRELPPSPQHKHKHFLCGDPPLKHLGELGVIWDTGGVGTA